MKFLLLSMAQNRPMVREWRRHWGTLESMVRNYRGVMGWDEETGLRRPRTPVELGLEELAKDLPVLSVPRRAKQ